MDGNCIKFLSAWTRYRTGQMPACNVPSYFTKRNSRQSGCGDKYECQKVRKMKSIEVCR